MAALSLATDLGTGRPMEHAFGTCLVAVRLGEAIGLSVEELTNLYYVSLLRFIGCTSESHAVAEMFGDELADGSWVEPLASGGPLEMVLGALRFHAAGDPPHVRAARVAKVVLGMPNLMHVSRAHCEVASRLAARLGFGPGVQEGLAQNYERWDGTGIPRRLRGDAIALASRAVTIALDAQVFHSIGGVDAAVAALRKRAGHAYDPHLVEAFCRHAPTLLTGLSEEATWTAVLAAEPGPQSQLTEEQMDEALQAMADFADLKSTYTLAHSSTVAQLSASAARICRLPEADVRMLWRAGMVHEIGQVGVSAGIWDKPGRLTESERERLRLHPYYTERVLSRPEALARISGLASLHHERLDGSGYHRSVGANALSPAARILGAACTYVTKASARPHRAALSADALVDFLQDEVQAGRLDGEATAAVLSAAGHSVRATRHDWPAGLSQREVEVLRLAARGLSRREVGRELYIAEKTVAAHIEHIYDKIGVSTRAGATLFAMQHGLLAAMEESPPK